MALEKTLRWIVLVGIFALPFIVFIIANTFFFPFITGKNFTFRIIVEIITGAWFALALIKTEYRPRKSWLLGAFAIFVLIIAIADLNGVYPFKSFWSNYERMDGWVTLAHLFAYFVVASAMLNTKKIWRKLWLTYLGVSVFSGLYGLLQLTGKLALGQGGASGLTARLDTTFGNPIYLAVFMLFNIFIAAFLWAERWNELQPGKRLGISLGYGTVLALDTIILFLTGTRGTMLGLIGGTLLAVFIVAVFDKNEGIARKIALRLAVALLILVAGFWFVRDQSWVHRVGFLDRLATISLNDSTVKARFMNWGMAWEGVKERPLLGWGQENYAIVFDKYYNPQMYAQEQWFDRVHNIIFDWLVAGGFLGLIGYLMLFVCALWCIWKRVPNTTEPRNAYEQQRAQSAPSAAKAFSFIEKSILTGLLAGYFFHNLFVFDNISSYILFATVLAYIVSRSSSEKNSPFIFQSVRFSDGKLPVLAMLVAVLVWGTSYGVNGKALAQNRALLQAIAPQKEGITKNLSYFQEAIAYGSLGTQEAREQIIQAASQIAGNKNVSDDVKKQFLEISAREMDLQAKASPLDARPPLFLGILLDAYGNYTNAASALKRAHELSPGKQTILFQQGLNAQARGSDAEALEFFKTAYELAPEFSNARIYYAAYAIRLGKDQLADDLLFPILKSGAAADQQIAAAYVGRGRFDKIVNIWKAKVSAQPNDLQSRLTLAAALYAMGQSGESILQLEETGKVIPSAKAQADSLIEQVKNGTAKI